MRCWLPAWRLKTCADMTSSSVQHAFLAGLLHNLWWPGRQLSCWRDRRSWPLQT